jgi:DsbC/DsbD-like thiol-disulfide interchange protein
MRDEKILIGWNGLMIGALARAGAALNQPEFVRSAEKAGVFVLTKMRDSQGRLAHSITNGRTQPNPFLDDYACVIDGLLALHSATRDARWLKEAQRLQDDQIKMFKDDAGGFFFTSHDHEELLARTKNCYDGVVPAGNSVSARNLLKLAKLTSDKRYREEAQSVLELFSANLEQLPRGSTVLAQAMSEFLAGEAPTRQSAIRQSTGVITAAADDAKAKQQPLVVFADQKEEAGVKPDEYVKAKAYLSVDRLPAGSACQIIVLVDVKKGWHVNANPPDPDYLKPIKITLKSKNGVKLGEVKYPKGEVFKFKDSDDQAMVYEGEVKIHGVLNIPKEAAGRTDEIEVAVEYQVCNEDGCRPPKSLKLTGKLGVAKPDETVGSVNARLFDTKLDPSR